MSEQPSIPGEHEVEPDLDVDQENPDLEASDDDEQQTLEPVHDDDLPEVDPYEDDDAVLDDEEN